MICSHTSVQQGFVSSFSSKLSGTWSLFVRTHIFLTHLNESPQPRCHFPFLYFCCLRQFRVRTNNMTDWLVTLLARYYRHKLLSLCYFILLSKGLSSAPDINEYPTQDSNGKDNYHYKCIFSRDKSRLL